MEKIENHIGKKAERLYTVRLEGMQFVGFHGCRQEEKERGNVFKVDFEGKYESACAVTDNLNDTVNYGKIYGIVSAVMNGARANLLETLSAGIIDAVIKEFPEDFKEIRVRVAKKNPPVAGPCEWSYIETEWTRND